MNRFEATVKKGLLTAFQKYGHTEVDVANRLGWSQSKVSRFINPTDPTRIYLRDFIQFATLIGYEFESMVNVQHRNETHAELCRQIGELSDADQEALLRMQPTLKF